MDPPRPPRISRRAVLRGALAVTVTTVLGACRDDRPPGAGRSDPRSPPGQALEPTPSCAEADEPTPAQSEGPYFTPDSPQRTNLLDGVSSGTRLVLAGAVVDTTCRPVGRALLDFWQADADGNYDNVGYRLRGHLFADDAGRFRLETIVPGLYPGRTRHIHVKVQPPGGRILTTQLYLPGERQNAADGLFRPEVVMQVSDVAEGKAATFTFVLPR